MASEKVIPFPTPTARFTLVVQRCGTPAVHLTLVSPRKDAQLQRLEHQNKVMTVHQAHRGEGADYGVVGLFTETKSQLLVFPKSLRRFAGKRIVGLNYDLLAGASAVTGALAASIPARKHPVSPVPSTARAVAKSQPEPKVVPMEPPAPPEPLTMPQVLRRVEAINRLLVAKKYVPARTDLGELAKSIRTGLEPS